MREAELISTRMCREWECHLKWTCEWQLFNRLLFCSLKVIISYVTLLEESLCRCLNKLQVEF